MAGKITVLEYENTKAKRILHWLWVLSFTLLISFAFSSCMNTTDDGAAVSQNGNVITKYGNGYRFDENGWVYIHIEGAPYERGFQHGYLVAPELKEILRSLEYLTYWNTGMTWKFFVEEAQKQFL